MTDASDRPVRGRLLVAAVLVGVTGLLTAAFLLVRTPTGGGSLGPMPGPDPGMGRVHALAVDPVDGSLYVAARYGLFRLSGGRGERVGDRYQDTHALVVTGPERLLASGHPDPRENLPRRLGLIESNDGGRNWQALSLEGQADFHHLGVSHGQVYGYDSAGRRLMTTGDRRTWHGLAALPMDDFALAPGDAQVMLAVSAGRLMESRDGGRTFTAVPAAPRMAMLAWPANGPVLAVTADGRVHTSDDAGRRWRPRGRVDGLPQAMTALDAARLYVATDTGVYRSGDGGATFTLYHREQ